MSDQVYTYENGAEIQTVNGWTCKKCHRWWGNDNAAEHLARACCKKSRPCETPGCTGRAEGCWTICDDCRLVKDMQRFEALPEIEWDGKTLLMPFDGDECFESLADAYDAGFRDMVVAQENEPPQFYLESFLSKVLIEDWPLETLDGSHEAIEDSVNNWIQKHRPYSYHAGKQRIKFDAALWAECQGEEE